ncbi:MAG: SAM-dependent methyltransferase [Acidobacteria bacterium]|nr:SAM-dependent methyltransferase [Acidobacteriota bacterium]
MPTDFMDAHRRHWEDGELLFNNERWANADQMYGFSAECGLKAVMKYLGMTVDTAGVPEEKYRKHVQELWPIFIDYAERRGGKRYLRRLPPGEPFADWSHHDRYAHRATFTKDSVEPHQAAAQRILDMVESSVQDGRP